MIDGQTTLETRPARVQFAALMTLPRLSAVILVPPICVGLAWLAGFLWFLSVANSPTPPPPDADGIVALTGGAERVDEALRLLSMGRGRLLLISGVPRHVDLHDLARRSTVNVVPLASRISLGRVATSTYGNGLETAAWAESHQLRSLIVVTAAYHMPRALHEISHALPGVPLYPAAVLPVPRQGTNDSGTIGMLAAEYTKWLASEAGLGFLSRKNAAS